MALFQVSSITTQQIGGDAVLDAVRVSVSNSMMVLKLLSNSSAFYRPLRWCSYFVEYVVSYGVDKREWWKSPKRRGVPFTCTIIVSSLRVLYRVYLVHTYDTCCAVGVGSMVIR